MVSINIHGLQVAVEKALDGNGHEERVPRLAVFLQQLLAQRGTSSGSRWLPMVPGVEAAEALTGKVKGLSTSNNRRLKWGSLNWGGW